MIEISQKMFTPEQAQKIANSAGQRAVDLVDELEIIRVGKPNAIGRIITREDIDQLYQKISRGVLEALTPQTILPQE